MKSLGWVVNGAGERSGRRDIGRTYMPLRRGSVECIAAGASAEVSRDEDKVRSRRGMYPGRVSARFEGEVVDCRLIEVNDFFGVGDTNVVE